MKHIIVSIYDKATEAYMRPWTALTVNESIRSFEDEVRRQDSPIGRHPEHYTLFQLGTFNDHTGTIDTMEPQPLRRAHEVQEK